MITYGHRRSSLAWFCSLFLGFSIWVAPFVPPLAKRFGYKNAVSLVTLSNPFLFFYFVVEFASPRSTCSCKRSRGTTTRSVEHQAAGDDGDEVVLQNDMDPRAVVVEENRNDASKDEVLPPDKIVVAKMNMVAPEKASTSTGATPPPPKRCCCLGVVGCIWAQFYFVTLVLIFVHFTLKIPYAIATLDEDSTKVIFAILLYPALREVINSRLSLAARQLVVEVVHKRGNLESPRVEVYLFGMSVFLRLIGRKYWVRERRTGGFLEIHFLYDSEVIRSTMWGPVPVRRRSFFVDK